MLRQTKQRRKKKSKRQGRSEGGCCGGKELVGATVSAIGDAYVSDNAVGVTKRESEKCFMKEGGRWKSSG